LAEAVRGVSFETEQLAWLVLKTVNRTQAKGSTVRLVVPRDPEVVDELGIPLTDDELLSAQEYLEDKGYVVLADVQLTRGVYTITPAGLEWLESGLPEPPEAPETAADEPERAEGQQRRSGGSEQPWWRRMFSG
jgi:hypothetical protein